MSDPMALQSTEALIAENARLKARELTFHAEREHWKGILRSKIAMTNDGVRREVELGDHAAWHARRSAQLENHLRALGLPIPEPLPDAAPKMDIAVDAPAGAPSEG